MRFAEIDTPLNNWYDREIPLLFRPHRPIRVLVSTKKCVPCCWRINHSQTPARDTKYIIPGYDEEKMGEIPCPWCCSRRVLSCKEVGKVFRSEGRGGRSRGFGNSWNLTDIHPVQPVSHGFVVGWHLIGGIVNVLETSSSSSFSMSWEPVRLISIYEVTTRRFGSG